MADPVEMHKVYSKSTLAAVGYDEENGLLYVRFKGFRQSVYSGVPREAFEALMESKSKGGYFHEHIRRKYPERVIS